MTSPESSANAAKTFVLSEDERMLKDTSSKFVADRMSPQLLRALRERPSSEGFDRPTWVEIAALGWTGIAVCEAYGGSGLGVRALAAVIEQLGAMLVPVPFVSTALVAALVLDRFAAAETAAGWLAKIAAGTCVAALAVDEAAQHSRDPPRTCVARGVNGLTVNGTKRYVTEGLAADLLLVSAVADERAVLALIRADSPGVTVHALTSIDSRGMADIRLDDAPVEALLTEVHGREPVAYALDCACIGLAAEMLGASCRALEMTLEYMRTRRQFGRPIGSFQALQHRAARLFIELELTRSCVAAAADALHRDQEVPLLASLAKASAAQSMRTISYEAIQLHGGIGMTDAHDAGLYLKRGRVAALLYGDADFHTDRYAALKGY